MKKKPAFKRASDGAYVMSNYLGRTGTVLLDCPIKAETRAVDKQSDLRILLQFWLQWLWDAVSINLAQNTCRYDENSRNWLLFPDIFQVTIKQVSSAHHWSQNKLPTYTIIVRLRKAYSLPVYNFFSELIMFLFLRGTPPS